MSMIDDQELLDDIKKADVPVSIEEAWCKLLEELPMRPSNPHTTSGKRGDIKLFMYLLMHDAQLQKIKQQSNTPILVPYFHMYNGQLLLARDYDTHDISVGDLRDILDDFIKNSDNATPLDITEEQSIDLNYMKEYKNRSLNLNLYYKCLEHAYKLRDALNSQSNIRKLIDERFNIETQSLVYDFLIKEGIGVGTSNSDEDSRVLDMISLHPHYSTQLDDIRKRNTSVLDALMGYEEKKLMNFLGSAPRFLVTLPLRLVIQIDMLVRYELDLHLPNLK